LRIGLSLTKIASSCRDMKNGGSIVLNTAQVTSIAMYQSRLLLVNMDPSLTSAAEVQFRPVDDQHLLLYALSQQFSLFSFHAMPPLPTELIIEILKLYFRYIPSTPLKPYSIPLAHAASLRLVDSTFDAIVHPLLFRSLTIITPRDFIRYFHSTTGVLVGDSEQAQERRGWVKEISLCFSRPDIPMKTELVGEDLTEYGWEEWLAWLAPLSIPAFPSRIRLVNIPCPVAQTEYYEAMHALSWEAWNDWLEENGKDAGRPKEDVLQECMQFMQDEWETAQFYATQRTIRPFFLDDYNNLTSYASISLLDVFTDYCTNFSFPNAPFSEIDPTERPLTFIYPSSLPLHHPSSLTEDFHEARWLASFPFSNLHLVNVRLVGYGDSEEPARERLRGVLSEKRRDGTLGDDVWEEIAS
jgi:hypothetical protein